MIFQDFIHTIKDCVGERFSADYDVSLQQVLKNNSVCYESLLIMQKGMNVSPLIYLNPYYHRYLNGMSIQDICDDICDVYYSKLPSCTINLDFFFDYDKVKVQLVPKLINYEKNKEMLINTPHVRYLDLAVVFLYLFPSTKESFGASDEFYRFNFGSILIRNEHLDLWGIDLDQLQKDALYNAPLLLPPEVKTMQELLDEFFCKTYFTDNEEEEECSSLMYVITNTMRINGAAVALYENILSEMAERLACDLVVLPSSIHEMILVPTWDIPRDELDCFTQMVQEVNATQVADDEILSNHAYYYDAASKELSII